MLNTFRMKIVATLAALGIASPALALEKISVPAPDYVQDQWLGSAPCNISYYNTCTGWIWVWSGWAPEDRFGTVFTSCCGGSDVTKVGAVTVNFYTGCPSGYGFTGTIDLFDADASGCPAGAPIASQPCLPVAGLNSFIFQDGGGNFFNVPDATFVIAVTLGPGSSPANPAAVVTDHPAAGPTGPVSCGTCFPAGRVAHSFYFGSPSSPICPGSPFFDDVCDAEIWMLLEASCEPNAVEASSWSAVKSLYR